MRVRDVAANLVDSRPPKSIQTFIWHFNSMTSRTLIHQFHAPHPSAIISAVLARPGADYLLFSDDLSWNTPVSPGRSLIAIVRDNYSCRNIWTLVRVAGCTGQYKTTDKRQTPYVFPPNGLTSAGIAWIYDLVRSNLLGFDHLNPDILIQLPCAFSEASIAVPSPQSMLLQLHA